ncbi:hypothetical protein TWF730_011018 [Orbilia blumenaviensis]|uniref:Uncharacterized protein n=1 Tax=Orbilia blumenaviensis TaxID=1796055 RepID=A0AAV9UK01_9PEZI
MRVRDDFCPRHTEITKLKNQINDAKAQLPRYENLSATLEVEQKKIEEWNRRLEAKLAETTPWSDGAE